MEGDERDGRLMCRPSVLISFEVTTAELCHDPCTAVGTEIVIRS